MAETASCPSTARKSTSDSSSDQLDAASTGRPLLGSFCGSNTPVNGERKGKLKCVLKKASRRATASGSRT